MAQLHSSLERLGWDVLCIELERDEHDVPPKNRPMPQKPPGKREGGIRQQQHDSAHEEILEAHSSGSRPSTVTRSCAQYDTGTTPDMVIWTVTACMLGRTGSGRLALIHIVFTPTVYL